MWEFLLFIHQLPTPNPSKNTMYTNKNFRTSCKMTYEGRDMIQGQGLSTYSLDPLLLPTLTQAPPMPSLGPFSLPLANPSDAPKLSSGPHLLQEGFPSVPALLPPPSWNTVRLCP